MSKHDQEYWMEKDETVIKKNYRFPSVVLSNSQGVYVTAVDGTRYVDFTSGGQTCNLGHNHPEIRRAVNEQIELTGFCSHGWMRNATRTKLAEKLLQHLTGKIENPQIGFCISGSDATELVMSLTKERTERHMLLCHFGCYHGSISTDALAMNTSAHTGSYPQMPGIMYQPFPYCYRCPFGQDPSVCDIACLDFLEYQFETNVIPPEETAAFFIELIQVHGGIIPMPSKYLSRLHKICKREGIQLVVDEVTTGFGRSGNMFAIDYYDIDVNVVYFAKSIANGLPLAAIVANKEIMSGFSGGGTFSGSPISCAAGLASFEILQRKDTLMQAQKVGRYLLERLNEIKTDDPLIGDVRGRGLLIGVEIVEPDKSPAPARTKKVIDHLLRAGVLVFPAGAYQNVLRLCPPLISTEPIVDVFMKRLEEALKKTSTINK